MVNDNQCNVISTIIINAISKDKLDNKHQNEYQELFDICLLSEMNGKSDSGGGDSHELTVDTECTSAYNFGPQFSSIQPVGHGANGLVFSAHHNQRKQDVAIKTLSIAQGQVGQRTLREIKILSRLKHENVVDILEMITHDGETMSEETHSEETGSQVLIVQELMDNDLHSLIVARQLQADHVVFFTYQLLRGLKYIHSLNIIHRDIKPCNILINCDTLELKITDFGISRIVDPNFSHKV